jgi:hypothetical protein
MPNLRGAGDSYKLLKIGRVIGGYDRNADDPAMSLRQSFDRRRPAVTHQSWSSREGLLTSQSDADYGEIFRRDVLRLEAEARFEAPA